MPLLTPRRRHGHEYLDDPVINARVAERSMADVARANAMFGGAQAVLTELDVGTGLGDIPARVRALGARRGVEVCTVGLDASETLVVAANGKTLPVVRADARYLPVADRSFDVVLCSQLLHHFPGDEGLGLVRELDRVARRRVIISDIRRSWVAAAGIWLASWPLRFHPVSRHDGVVSVMRGFTVNELIGVVHTAVGVTPRVRRRRGFRVTASWEPVLR